MNNNMIACNGVWVAVLHKDNVIRVWNQLTGERIDNKYACKHWFDCYTKG